MIRLCKAGSRIRRAESREMGCRNEMEHSADNVESRFTDKVIPRWIPAKQNNQAQALRYLVNHE